MTSQDRRARLQSLFPALRATLDARADGQPLQLSLLDVLVDEGTRAEIRLTAAIPYGSRTFTWRSTLVSGSYPIVVQSVGGREVIEWVRGMVWTIQRLTGA